MLGSPSEPFSQAVDSEMQGVTGGGRTRKKHPYNPSLHPSLLLFPETDMAHIHRRQKEGNKKKQTYILILMHFSGFCWTPGA